MREICRFSVSDDEQTSLMLLTDMGGKFRTVWEGLMDDSLMLKCEPMSAHVTVMEVVFRMVIRWCGGLM